MSPRPCLAMKLTASAVTWSAANTRSPSFSRSSSSTRMTILPARRSAMISSVEARVFGIALYFKLRSPSLLVLTAISSLSDGKSLGRLFSWPAGIEKMRGCSVHRQIPPLSRSPREWLYFDRGFSSDELNFGRMDELDSKLPGLGFEINATREAKSTH